MFRRGWGRGGGGTLGGRCCTEAAECAHLRRSAPRAAARNTSAGSFMSSTTRPRSPALLPARVASPRRGRAPHLGYTAFGCGSACSQTDLHARWHPAPPLATFIRAFPRRRGVSAPVDLPASGQPASLIKYLICIDNPAPP